MAEPQTPASDKSSQKREHSHSRIPINTAIAIVAFLFMIASVYFNFIIVQRAAVSGRVTQNESGLVTMCINEGPVMTACSGFAAINITYICIINPQDRDSFGEHTYTANTTLFNITNFNASHGYIVFTPNETDKGIHTVNITVNDNFGCDNSIMSRLQNFLVADPQCIDGEQNGAEEGIDCGGGCPGFCEAPLVNGTVYIQVFGNSTSGNTTLIANATVYIGQYYNYTNASGGVRFNIPALNYSISGVKSNYLTTVTNISIVPNNITYFNLTLQPIPVIPDVVINNIAADSSAKSSSSGGGGFGVPIPREKIYFHVRPALVRISVHKGETKSATFTVSNPMSRVLNFSVSNNLKLQWISMYPKIFQLLPSDTQDVVVTASPDKDVSPGVYFGKITITGYSKFGEISTTTIGVIIEVETSSQYFDVSLNIPGRYRTLAPGDTVKANVAVFSLGTTTEKEVELVFQILGEDGHVWAESSSNLHIKDKAIFDKIMSLPPDIPEGDYLFTARVSYGGSVGTSTELFTIKGAPKPVIEAPQAITPKSVMPLVWIILALAVIVLGIVVYRASHRSQTLPSARSSSSYNSSSGSVISQETDELPGDLENEERHPQNGLVYGRKKEQRGDEIATLKHQLELFEQGTRQGFIPQGTSAAESAKAIRKTGFIHPLEVTKKDKALVASVLEKVQDIQSRAKVGGEVDKEGALEYEKQQLLFAIQEELDAMEAKGISVESERKLLATLMKGGKSGKKRGRQRIRPSSSNKKESRRKKENVPRRPIAAASGKRSRKRA